jgi:hypothetical protein
MQYLSDGKSRDVQAEISLDQPSLSKPISEGFLPNPWRSQDQYCRLVGSAGLPAGAFAQPLGFTVYGTTVFFFMIYIHVVRSRQAFK